MSSKSFWTSDMMSKNDVLTSILMFFCQKFSRSGNLWPPLPFVFTAITDRVREKSRWAIVHSALWHQSILQPILVWGPIECGGRRVLSRACSLLFLSVLMLPHHSGQISETTALYITHVPNIGRSEREIKTEQTPVVDGLPGPQLN
jgi:hypothetical protein